MPEQPNFNRWLRLSDRLTLSQLRLLLPLLSRQGTSVLRYPPPAGEGPSTAQERTVLAVKCSATTADRRWLAEQLRDFSFAADRAATRFCFVLPAQRTINTARARGPPEKGRFGRGGQHNLLGSYSRRSTSGC